MPAHANRSYWETSRTSYDWDFRITLSLSFVEADLAQTLRKFSLFDFLRKFSGAQFLGEFNTIIASQFSGFLQGRRFFRSPGERIGYRVRLSDVEIYRSVVFVLMIL